MSRIGRLPIALPQGVTIAIDADHVVTVKGPKGTLVSKMSNLIDIKNEDGHVVVARPNDEKQVKALHGLTRALLGYKASKQGNKLVLNVGYSHPVEIDPLEGIDFDIPAATQVVVKGIDKQRVGQMAAVIRDVRRPEPYLGKGIKYSDEVIRRKEGKTGKK
jgi:large subunit ribosomal protein L6